VRERVLRTVLVTGHSKGIGLAISEALLQAGHSVIGVSRTRVSDRDRLTQYSTDLSDLSATSALAKSLLADLSSVQNQANTLDAVVCNAGIGQFGALENFSAQQIEHSIQLNLISPLVLLRSLLPALKKHSRSDIVFIASESAVQAGRFGSVYSAAKFGLRGAAQSLRAECASANCHVGIVNPGMVRTEFFKQLSFEPGDESQHALLAQNVATSVMSMLSSPDNAVIEELNVRPLQHVVQKKKQ